MSDTLQHAVWEAQYSARHALQEIAKAVEACQDDQELSELADFAHVSIMDAQYFLVVITRRLRERENKVPDDINAEEKV